MHRRLSHGATALVCAVLPGLVAGCSKEPETAPRIVSLAVISGAGQSGFVGALLPAPLVVRAADQEGVPVSGARITWSVASGGGTLTPAESVTDADGLASTTYRLGGTLGQQSVEATLPGGQPVTFLATAVTAPASQIVIVSGDNQTGVVRTTLPADLTVKVSDAFGNVKANIAVVYSVILGNGTLSSSVATTDAGGIAKVTWTLGPPASTQRVAATIPGIVPVIFDATATPAAPALVVVVSGNNQSAQPGALLPDSLVIRVTDQYDNPVKDVNVAWTATGAAGTLSPASGKTDLVGRLATAWTLGLTSGPKEVRATASGLQPAIFQAAGTIIFATVQAGGRHSCAIDTGGVAFCWGFNEAGQLGIGSVTPGTGPVFANLVPNAVVGGHTFRTGSSGASHSCAITVSNSLYCWGLNNDGRLGNGQSGADLKVPTPTAVAGSFDSVSAGAEHTCGLTTSDRLFCWGSNAEGKVGVGSATPFFPSPQAVSLDLSFRSVAAGGFHSCAVSTAGTVYCWGSNARGQAGLGPEPGSNVPAPVDGTDYAEIVAGENHTCGRQQGEDVFCWGDNEFGQLGDGTNAPRDAPTLLSGFAFTSITAGKNHTCGLTAAGIAYCWGLGTSGQLGHEFGYVQSSNIPLVVGGGHTFRMISAGGLQTCGVTFGNVVYCWGDNQFGALGDGTQTSRSLPTKVVFQP